LSTGFPWTAIGIAKKEKSIIFLMLKVESDFVEKEKIILQ
jgi:hypothetical protein